MLKINIKRKLGAIVLGLFAGGNLLANPNHQDPDAAIAVHDVTGAKTTLEEVQQRYQKCREATSEIAERHAAGGAGKLSPKLLSDTRVALDQLKRLAVELQLHGETAGYDFELRHQTLYRTLSEALTVFNASPNGMAQTVRSRAALQRNQKARDADLAKAKELGAQGEWERAYDAIHKLNDETTALSIFLPPAEISRIHYYIFPVMTTVTASRNAMLRTSLIEKLEQRRTETAPDLQALTAEVKAAASALQTSATVDIEGQPQTGPQAMTTFLARWQQAHAAALLSRGMGWAARVHVKSLNQVNPPPPDTAFETAYTQFCQEMTSALVSLIRADAARAAASEVPTLYSQYVAAIAPVLSRVAGEDLQNQASEALGQLAAKAPDFASDVRAYQAATDEFLRWKERASQTISSAYQSQTSAFPEAVVRAAVSEGDFAGLFDWRTPDPVKAQLMGAAPPIVDRLADRVMNQPTTLDGVAGMANKQIGIGLLDRRSYATVPLPSLQPQITELKTDLLITEQLPALSLNAAAAVASAENGDYTAVGGQIKGVYLEGLVSRFASLPASAWPLIKLGPLPAEERPSTLLNHTLTRCTLQPTWVAHRYFFAEIAAAPAGN